MFGPSEARGNRIRAALRLLRQHGRSAAHPRRDAAEPDRLYFTRDGETESERISHAALYARARAIAAGIEI